MVRRIVEKPKDIHKEDECRPPPLYFSDYPGFRLNEAAGLRQGAESGWQGEERREFCKKKKRGSCGVGGQGRVLESLGRRAWWRESDEQLEEKRNGKRDVRAGEGRWCLKEEILPKGIRRERFSRGAKEEQRRSLSVSAQV